MRYPVLALLSDAPAHGYEIKRGLEERFGAVIKPLNAGQVYVTLQRLARDELVEDATVAQDGRPDKRVYRLTDAGPAGARGVAGHGQRADAPARRLLHEARLRPRLGLADPPS
jgi:DNA-binding PadR family transcriptional regulator